MIEIPGGKILLRDDRINEEWKVDIKTFLLSRFPVTQKQYFDITGQSPSSFKGDRNPVENVSWMDAVLFCNLYSEKEGLEAYYKLEQDRILEIPGSPGYRLPSEAEWEFACKAGSNDVRYGDLGFRIAKDF